VNHVTITDALILGGMIGFISGIVISCYINEW
jgi:hypothetical protein